jgi:murein DD-endopeptidase MepM/ murein hydrolase activator NlpD
MKVVCVALRRFAPLVRMIVAILIGGTLAACSADSTRLTADFREPAASAPSKSRALASAPSGRWTWDGGTGVTVRRGETVSTIARRHHVPVSAMIQVNNLSSPDAVRPRQRLVLPSYRVSTAGAGSEPGGVEIRPPADVGIDGNPARIASSSGDLSSSHPDRRSTPRPDKPNVAGTPRRTPTATVLKRPPPTVSKTIAAAAPDGARSTASLKPGGTSPVFSWPAQGPVITRFGAEVEDRKSDGIDIAVPEATPIKAADDGVVVYVGSALESYGNLVLVRHADDYVSVYAHAKALRVKPGDKVRRGEVIGESGRTGDVKEPRLHFEVRKGSIPVDPLPLLRGA